MSRKKVTHILAAVLLCALALCVDGALGADVYATTEVASPRIVENTGMSAEQKTTWDCVWFGSYPQTEIVSHPVGCGTYEKAWEKDGDYEVNETLYRRLTEVTDWDSNGDTVLNGVRYRRISQSDALKVDSENGNHYNWRNGLGYHYFRYEKIKWRVLDVEKDGNLVLLADKGLDTHRYNDKNDMKPPYWRVSSIRSWLNGYEASVNHYRVDYTGKGFIDIAFSEAERAELKDTELDNIRATYGVNKNLSNDPYYTTTDKVYLLSALEGCIATPRYGFSYCNVEDEARICASSTFAKAMGLESEKSSGRCLWWLRTTSEYTDSDSSYFINCAGRDGDLFIVGNKPTGALAVRPACRIPHSSSLWSYAGTVCSDGTVEEGGTQVPEEAFFDPEHTYPIGDPENLADCIYFQRPPMLPLVGEKDPEGVYLWRKEDDGQYVKIHTFSFEDFSWGAKYFDKNVRKGHRYTYALQTYDGSELGKMGEESSIVREIPMDIVEVTVDGYDWNRIPISSNSGVLTKIHIRLAKSLPASMIRDENGETFFTGKVALSYKGEVKKLWLGSESEIFYEDSEKTLEVRLPGEHLDDLHLPSNGECTITILNDQYEETTGVATVKTSFQRLQFKNPSEERFSDELFRAFFGTKKGNKFAERTRGNNIGKSGLCFGMAAVVDQFQAGMYDPQELLGQERLDKASANTLFRRAFRLDDSTLMDFVKFHHLYQFTEACMEELDSNCYNIYGLIQKIGEYRSGKSKLMPMIWLESFQTSGDQHALLAYDYEVTHDNGKVGMKIYVYEPSYPYSAGSEKYITISDYYGEDPSWNYPQGDNYGGSLSQARARNVRFSYLIPDWDIFSFPGINGDILMDTEDLDYMKWIKEKLNLAPGSQKRIRAFEFYELPLLWLSGSGEMEFPCGGKNISLISDLYAYEIGGADSVKMELEAKRASGSSSRVKSMTVKGDGPIRIHYAYEKDGEEKDSYGLLENTGEEGALFQNDASDLECAPVTKQFADGLAWTYDNGVLTISGEGAVPDYDVYTDTPWYGFRNSIVKLVLSEGITGVGKETFQSRKSILYKPGRYLGEDCLREVVFPSTLRNIGNMAFYNCNQLTEITLPKGFDGRIGTGAFYYCYSLKKLDLGEKLTSLGATAFAGCHALEEVTIPASVTEIEDGTRDSIKPEGASTMQFGCFGYCDKLKKLHYQSTARVADYMFESCKALEEVDLPEGVTEIGNYAFAYCNALIRVTLPRTLVKQGTCAFESAHPDLKIRYHGDDDSGGSGSGEGGGKARIVPVSRITLSGISAQIAAGKSLQLSATVSPASATHKALRWSSSDPKVASVDQRGKVTVKPKTGGKTVVITASARDGSGKKATWRIRVMKGQVKRLTVKKVKKTLKVGKTQKLKVKVKATKGASKQLRWISGNPNYAVVSSGRVRALPAGKGKTVRITVMSTDGTNLRKTVTLKIA